MLKYYENEKPVILTSHKNVVKVYKENGKIQVFPRVPTSKYGIGRGSTIDLEEMTKEQIEKLNLLLQDTIFYQINKRTISL